MEAFLGGQFKSTGARSSLRRGHPGSCPTPI